MSFKNFSSVFTVFPGPPNGIFIYIFIAVSMTILKVGGADAQKGKSIVAIRKYLSMAICIRPDTGIIVLCSNFLLNVKT